METKIYGEIDKVTLFRMTQGAGNRNLKDLEDGQRFDVEAAALINDGSDEESKQVLFFVSDKGIISTTSPTAIKTYLTAVDFFESHKLILVKISGKSKGGRSYVNLDIAGVI